MPFGRLILKSYANYVEILNKNLLQIISKIDHIELTEHTALTNKEAPSPATATNP